MDAANGFSNISKFRNHNNDKIKITYTHTHTHLGYNNKQQSKKKSKQSKAKQYDNNLLGFSFWMSIEVQCVLITVTWTLILINNI